MIPTLASLPAPPRRIILHWTGGGPTANAIDRAHYHYLVEQSGRIVAGVHPVAVNLAAPLRSGRYAAHTGGMNTGSVGLSFCGMGGAARGRKFGPHPLTEPQVAAGLRLVADLCRAWGLQPSPEHVFTHAEAWTLHGVRGTMNPQKWDITELEFKPDLAPHEVGPWLRAEVARYLAEGAPLPELPVTVPAPLPGIR